MGGESYTEVRESSHVGIGGVYDDDGGVEKVVSKVSIFVSEASELSTGARILGARRALKF